MKRHTSKPRRGATLIDVATGSMILSVLLIPSIHLIGESRNSHRRLINREIILHEAENLAESSKVALSDTAAFNAVLATPVDVLNSIAVPDGPDLTSRVRIAADTTIPSASLLSIVVDVWHDVDRNRSIDANETSATLRTQWASP